MQTVVKINVYERIVAEMKNLIELGVLANGEKLPSVRAYAVERRVNPTTVAKAYSVLEEEGYIVVLLKKGAYVSYDRGKNREQTEAIRQELLAWKTAGVERGQVELLLEEIYGGEDLD